MRGQPDVGSIKQVAEVKPHEGGFRGRLSIPIHGTQFTEVYPSKEDATAALADIISSIYGDNQLYGPVITF